MDKIKKPWGHEIIWSQNSQYMGKLISINPGHRTSKKYHQFKEETFYITKGILYNYLPTGEIERILPGGVLHIKPRQVHQIGACETRVELIEISTPHLGDVIRIEDDYERAEEINEELEELYRIYGGD